MRKWLNIPSGADEFHSDYAINGKNLIPDMSRFVSNFIWRFGFRFKGKIPLFLAGKTDERRKSCSDEDYYVIVPEDFSGIFTMLQRHRFNVADLNSPPSIS